MAHHCWLLSFRSYPGNSGPWWTGWLLYGHLAVVVFIVLSGFSLAVGPARAGWRLDGVGRFLRRRAWRILPPYWAALAVSLAIAWAVLPQPGEPAPTARSVLVHGLLLQDVFGSPSPNGAFWSIAVEAQLYLVFPLLMLVRRWAGPAVLLGLVTALVVAVGVLAASQPLVAKLLRLSPQMAVLFALGLVAAGLAVRVSTGGGTRRWAWLAATAALPPLLLVVLRGPEWTVRNYFWVDLAVGPSVALLLVAVTVGRPRPLVWLLQTRAVRRLGSFSYSLYLVHAPLVVMLSELVVVPRLGQGLPAMLVTLAIGVPLSVLGAWAFATVFELPFQRYRSYRALRAAFGGHPDPDRTAMSDLVSPSTRSRSTRESPK